MGIAQKIHPQVYNYWNNGLIPILSSKHTPIAGQLM